MVRRHIYKVEGERSVTIRLNVGMEVGGVVVIRSQALYGISSRERRRVQGFGVEDRGLDGKKGREEGLRSGKEGLDGKGVIGDGRRRSEKGRGGIRKTVACTRT